MLTERRKADRKKMTDEVAALARSAGFRVEFMRPMPGEDGLTIHTLRGLEVIVRFDGHSRQPDVFVLPWHMDHDATAKLADTFGSVYHRQKSTMVAEGFEDLKARLIQAFAQILDGSAFLPERDPDADHDAKRDREQPGTIDYETDIDRLPDHD